MKQPLSTIEKENKKAKAEAKKRAKEQINKLFFNALESFGLPKPTIEHAFHPSRKWRMDYAWPQYRVALEVEGGVWTGGRHTRGQGFKDDIEKYNSAAMMGWRIIRTVPDDLLKIITINTIKSTLTFKIQ